MKKTITAIFLAAVLALTMTGCVKIKIGKPATTTVVSMNGIRSMAVDGRGKVYLLTDTELRSYALSRDQKLEYVFDGEDMDGAKFIWADRGETVEYSDFRPERLIANGETGLQFLAVYKTNDLGRERELFVVQDIVDMNYSAAVFNEIEPGGSPAVNGVGVTGSALYIKLNRDYAERKSFNNGVKFEYDGVSSVYEMPDNVIGAIDGEDETVYFLTESAEIIKDGDTVFTFDGDVLSAFVSGDGAYAIYPDGQVVRWTEAAGEENFAELGTELTEAKDPFIWNGAIYWYDKEGVKTAPIK